MSNYETHAIGGTGDVTDADAHAFAGRVADELGDAAKMVDLDRYDTSFKVRAKFDADDGAEMLRVRSMDLHGFDLSEIITYEGSSHVTVVFKKSR